MIRSRLLLMLFVFVFVSAAVVAGCGTQTTETTTVVATTTTTLPSDEIEPITGDFEHVVSRATAQVRPAVVQITSQQVQTGQANQPFNVPTGVGSGVIYDDQGHIITNNHVIEGAESLLVSLPDGRSFPGKVIGADPQTDIAVIQVTGDNLNLPVADLGDSTQLQIGDWVVAIGNALALSGGPTVTTGVVSAMGRAVQEPGDGTSNANGPFLFDVIQTDAAVNPGNSGGPLISLAGKVIGINTLVAGGGGFNEAQTQGIGFAISMNVAKPIADELVASGKVEHPFLGIQYTPLDAATASHLGITGTTEGALVMNVSTGSPADGAGVKARDVITEIDGKALAGDSAFASTINAHKVGDTITLTILRDNQSLSIKVTLGKLSG